MIQFRKIIKSYKKLIIIVCQQILFYYLYFANVPRSFKKNIIELCSGNGGISIILREKTDAKIEMLEIQEDLVELTKKKFSIK